MVTLKQRPLGLSLEKLEEIHAGLIGKLEEIDDGTPQGDLACQNILGMLRFTEHEIRLVEEAGLGLNRHPDRKTREGRS